MEEYFEYAVRIDCAKNGCETPHNDDGLVWSDGGRLRLLPQEINRHAVTRVRRMIGEWEVDSDASGGQMRDRNEPAWVSHGESKASGFSPGRFVVGGRKMKKKLSVAAGFVAVFLVAGVAWAAWTTTGAGGKEVE